MSNKIHPKIIEKIASGYKLVPSVSATGANTNITSSISSIFATGALEGRALPVVNSTSELTPGLIVTGDYNKVPLLVASTGLPLTNITGDMIYGRLTYSAPNYTVTYYYKTTVGVETAYSIPAPTTLSMYLPYRGEFNHLSADDNLFSITSKLFGSPAPGAVKPTLNTELLTVTGLNTLSLLSQTPYSPLSVKLIFGGIVVSAQDSPTPFVVTGTIINWNPVNAGFDIDLLDNVIAEYLV